MQKQECECGTATLGEIKGGGGGGGGGGTDRLPPSPGYAESNPEPKEAHDSSSGAAHSAPFAIPAVRPRTMAGDRPGNNEAEAAVWSAGAAAAQFAAAQTFESTTRLGIPGGVTSVGTQ